MSLNDLLSDALTRIRNGQTARLRKIKCPASKLVLNVLEVLKKEGYIAGFKKVNVRKNIDEIEIELKYNNDKPAISKIARVSRPGLRKYSGSGDDTKRFYNGLGVVIISTSKGVMSDYQAHKLGVGGEVLCSVF